MNRLISYRLFEDDNRKMRAKQLSIKDGFLAGTVVYTPENGDQVFWSLLKEILVLKRDNKFYQRINVSNEKQIRDYYGEVEYKDLDSNWKPIKENPYTL